MYENCFVAFPVSFLRAKQDENYQKRISKSLLIFRWLLPPFFEGMYASVAC
jgi:hypothetical protein